LLVFYFTAPVVDCRRVTGGGLRVICVVSAARELFWVYPRQPTYQTLDMGCCR